MVSRSEQGWGSILSIATGKAIQYASIITGVYSVTRDEPSLGLAVGAGIAYLTGESLVRAGESSGVRDNPGLLETTLRDTDSEESS